MANKKITVARLWEANHDEQEVRDLIQPDNEQAFRLYIKKLIMCESPLTRPDRWDTLGLEGHKTIYNRYVSLVNTGEYR